MGPHGFMGLFLVAYNQSSAFFSSSNRSTLGRFSFLFYISYWVFWLGYLGPNGQLSVARYVGRVHLTVSFPEERQSIYGSECRDAEASRMAKTSDLAICRVGHECKIRFRKGSFRWGCPAGSRACSDGRSDLCPRRTARLTWGWFCWTSLARYPL